MRYYVRHLNQCPPEHPRSPMICHAILEPIVVLIRSVIRIIRHITRTVCELVSLTVIVIKEVTNKVCKWLPWPLNKVCSWVTKLVEVIETVWDWVCKEVIERIVEWITLLIELVIFILTWVCWAVDWVIRGPMFLLCLAGIRPRKSIGVCVKVLADEQGTPAIPLSTIQTWLNEANVIFRRCNIRMVVCGFEIIKKPEYLTSTTCDPVDVFSKFFSWFSSRSCSCCSTVTVYFVKSMKGASGCAFPGTSWIRLDESADGTVIVHEIGHLADLWPHSKDPDNVMTNLDGGTHDQLTRFQCCMIRTSRFARFKRPCA